MKMSDDVDEGGCGLEKKEPKVADSSRPDALLLTEYEKYAEFNFEPFRQPKN